MNREIPLRVGGTLLGVLLGFATGAWEVFLSPLYLGGVPLPVSPVAAILTNLGLVWFTFTVTGRRGLALLPGVAWFAVMLLGAGRTTEGDVLMPGNDYMGLAAVLLGALAWAYGAYRMIVPRPTRDLTGGSTSARPAGKPSGVPTRPAGKPTATLGRPAGKPPGVPMRPAGKSSAPRSRRRGTGSDGVTSR